MIAYKLTPEAALREAQAGRDSTIDRRAVGLLNPYETWAWVGRELIRGCDLHLGGALREVPALPAQGRTLSDDEAVVLAREAVRRRNREADEHAKSWVVCPEYRRAEMSARLERDGEVVRVEWLEFRVDELCIPSAQHLSDDVARLVAEALAKAVEDCAQLTVREKAAAYARAGTEVSHRQAEKAAKETLATRRRRWLVATAPEWREAVDVGALSDAGVVAEVSDLVLRGILGAMTGLGVEVLRANAPVFDAREVAHTRATPRELAQRAAAVRTRLAGIAGLTLRAWTPEAVMFDGQTARTVSLWVWCEAAATEVRGRIVLDRGEP